jgi:hypothetical protein
MKINIAIPSYKREQILVTKTLAYLYNTNVPRDWITIFVADRNELRRYQKVIRGINLIVGVPTLKGQRAFIRNYYKKDDWVFNIDDDIEGIYRAVTSNNKDLQLVTDLKSFLMEGFTTCKKFNLSLWGVSAVINAFFMYGKMPTFDLKYICGGAYGEIIDKDKFLDVQLEDKEDFERSIRHYIKCNAVLRFNDYALKTRGYAGAGGMQETRTPQRVEYCALALLKMFPRHCVLNTAKKNKRFVEVKLKVTTP